MEIRDVLYGGITVDQAELPILESPSFQRLRRIRQAGFAEASFPGACHSRFVHSLGVLHAATKILEAVLPRESSLSPADYQRFRALVRLAALLHDVGHGPLSHSSESGMPLASQVAVPGQAPDPKRRATHEDYTLKFILDSPLTALLKNAGAAQGFGPEHIAALIDPKRELKDDFFSAQLLGQNINFRPLLQQIISSEIDADRIDYLRRDSHFAGVSYGVFDFDWLVGNLTFTARDGNAYLALKHRAIYAFEDFLISRFHMFLMVYFHYKSVIYDEMLKRFFESDRCAYQIPHDIESYTRCDDHHLFSHLEKSTHPWARRIAERDPYRMHLELHSGIPKGPKALEEQNLLLRRITSELDDKKVPYMICKSTGELSKYFGSATAEPIFVHYDDLVSGERFLPLASCTDLFTRYSEKRSITRLYVAQKT